MNATEKERLICETVCQELDAAIKRGDTLKGSLNVLLKDEKMVADAHRVVLEPVKQAHELMKEHMDIATVETLIKTYMGVSRQIAAAVMKAGVRIEAAKVMENLKP